MKANVQLGLGVAFMLAAASASAQPVCVPNAIGVPGQPGPPPWWGGGSGPIDDPRWQGAMSIGHDNDDAQFRALQYTDGTQKYLVLSWDVKADSGGATGTQDYLHVGFWDAAAARGNVIKVTRTQQTTLADGTFAGGAFAAEVRYRDSTTAGAWNLISAIPPAPAWLQTDALLGATCVAGPPPLCTRWNIRMRVPVGVMAAPVSNPAAGLPMPDTFSLWYELHVEHSGSTITRYKFPFTAPNVIDLPLTYPNPASEWSPMSTAGGSCAGGVSLDYAQITTDNAISSQISTVAPNVFHARPLNGTSASIAGNAVRARFRIANWGSVIFSSPEWIDINPSSPSCASATGSPAPVPGGSNFDLSCSWTLTPEQQCAYRPDVHSTCSPMPTQRHAHQCILVELSSTTGVVFSRTSAWNNMQFVTASKVEQRATVSIRGLPALSGSTARDVYLYVSTNNLPIAPPKGDVAGARNDPRPRFSPVGTKEGERLKALVREGRLPFTELAAKMPAYVVRVYHDTGERVTAGPTTYAVIEPMPSFGYFVMHDGEIEGWQHKLAAAGAVELAPGFYKIAVPNDGSAEVTTEIEAVEAGPVIEPTPEPEPTPTEPPPSAPNRWLWLLLLLGVLVVIFFLLRRRGS